ncbi:tropomyosin, smooth muscle/fibroblast CTM1-like [Palaemon carinicauda]|uniref:tropomyosin, smooth muscle/fibroblast CTM1-like n=1 Tax=Palaemon carinicauda TaxID=392227 RepID=UPI0035B5DAC7
MAWCCGDEDLHRQAEKFLDLMDREEMERLHPAVYDGANYVAGETKEHAQLEEASQKDLSEELDGVEEGTKLLHQETETTNDLQRICEEVHDAEEEEIELSKDNIAISALKADLDRGNKKIKGLMANLEKAESQNDRNFDRSFWPRHLFSLEKDEARNDQIRDELFAKAYVEKELENAHEEIRILEKRLERVTRDLETAKEKLLEKRDLEEYVESADNEIRTLGSTGQCQG